MSKKKKESTETIIENEFAKDDVVEAAKVAEPIIYESVFKTGRLRGKSFKFITGSKNIIIDGISVEAGLATVKGLNPHGDILQVDFSVQGYGSNVIGLERDEGEALIAAVNTVRAAKPAQSVAAGLVAGARSYVKKTVAAKTAGCSDCARRRGR